MATAVGHDIKTKSSPKVQDFSGVQEKYISEKKGKGLFAARPFKPGDVIFEEEPLVSCQFIYNKEYGYTACSHCLRPLEGAQTNVRRLAQDQSIVLPHEDCCSGDIRPVLCPHCEREEYCSKACCEAAFSQYHRVLCSKSSVQNPSHPIEKLKTLWKSVHYPPESLSIMLLLRLLGTAVQSQDLQAALSRISEFSNSSFKPSETVTNKLLSPEFTETREKLRILVAEVFLNEPTVKQWLTFDGFFSLLAILATNAQGIGSSPLSAWINAVEDKEMDESKRLAINTFINELYERMDHTVGEFLNSEGSGLYSVQSRINHSCESNAIITFPYNCHVMRIEATAAIEPGQEITICYLDDCDRFRSRHSRQKILRENYLFSCECDVCNGQAGDPDLTSEEEEEEDSSASDED